MNTSQVWHCILRGLIYTFAVETTHGHFPAKQRRFFVGVRVSKACLELNFHGYYCNITIMSLINIAGDNLFSNRGGTDIHPHIPPLRLPTLFGSDFDGIMCSVRIAGWRREATINSRLEHFSLSNNEKQETREDTNEGEKCGKRRT